MIDESGVLGQVTRVYPLVSEVTLVIDREQAIPVLNVRTGARSVAYGDPSAHGALLELRFMAGNADVQIGDLLTTSGVDGVYPPGLPVAKVEKVERRADSGFARILCAPQALVDGARHVMVLHAAAGADSAAPGPRTRPCAGQEGAAQMIMRPGQQLLLPANPVFIWTSLLLALLVNMLPLGRTPWMPDLLALVLVFWSVHQPLRVGIGVAFVFGLAMDVHQAGAAGPARAGLHGAELLRHHHPPAPAVVQRALAGAAGAAAVRGRPRHRDGRAHAGGRRVPGLRRAARPCDRIPALAGGQRAAAGAAAPRARPGRKSAAMSANGLRAQLKP